MTGARVDAVDAIRDRRIDDFFVANKPSVIPVTPGRLRDVIKLLFPKIRDFITVNDEHLLEINEDLRSQISCLEKELAVLRNEM